MKNKFPGFYPPKPEVCAANFKECIFTFDTNVLLNLYRYTPDSRDNLLKVLEAVKDRVWLPNQVAYEYHDNRIGVIIGQRDMYEELKDAVDSAINELDKQRRSRSHHVTTIIEPIRRAMEEVKADLDKKKADHPDLFKNDPILDALTVLFDGKVGDAYDPDIQKKRVLEAKQRFEAKIPPGFLDNSGRKKKEGDKKYGDAIIWFQLLEYAKKEDKPLILIIDEAGDDWWSKDGGRTIGPRPELLQEMHKEANGKWFFMYSTERFLEYSKDLLELEVKPGVIKEAKEIKKEDEKRAATERAFWASEAMRAELERQQQMSKAMRAQMERPFLASEAMRTMERPFLASEAMRAMERPFLASEAMRATERAFLASEAMRTQIERQQQISEAMRAQIERQQRMSEAMRAMERPFFGSEVMRAEIERQQQISEAMRAEERQQNLMEHEAEVKKEKPPEP
jgi:hypothetical protein